MSIFRLKTYFNQTAILITLLILSGLIMRIVLVSFHWPATNSDEAVIGLMAQHIIDHGELPIFFYGQHYMGAFQAYLASLFFRFLPASVFTMRLSMLVIYPCLLVSMYFLTKRLYSKGLAIFVVALFSLGSG